MKQAPERVARTALAAGIGAVCAGTGYALLVRGALTVDVGVGRRVRPLGPLSRDIGATPQTVFDVIAGPYLGPTPRAMGEKLRVLERASDMVLAEHFTKTPWGAVATTLETVRFERPRRVTFRLVRGPVPHVTETFDLTPSQRGTLLVYQGEMGTDLWAAGRWWGERVARVWETTVDTSFDAIVVEAERRARG